MAKQTWMVTVAGKQSLVRGAPKWARAQAEVAVEQQAGTLSAGGDPVLWLEQFRAGRRWEKEGGQYRLFFGKIVRATLDPA